MVPRRSLEMARANRFARIFERPAVKPAGSSKFVAAERIMVLVALFMGVLGSELIAVGTGLAFFAAGLPHGFLRETKWNPRLRSAWYWAAYLLAATLVLLAFLLFPVVALSIFLGLSLIHFAFSDAHRDRFFNAAIGCLAVGGSALFQPSSTAAMFTAVAGQEISSTLVGVIAAIGAAGVMLTAVLIIRNPKGYGALLLAAGLVAFLHPVLAVGAVFYLFHAAPIQRRVEIAPAGSNLSHLIPATSVLSICGSGMALIAVTYGGMSVALASAAAIAFITPHLFEHLIDRKTAGKLSRKSGFATSGACPNRETFLS